MRAVAVWAHEVDDGAVRPGEVRMPRQEYDGHSRLIGLSAFADAAVTGSAVYSYNPAGPLIERCGARRTHPGAMRADASPLPS